MWYFSSELTKWTPEPFRLEDVISGCRVRSVPSTNEPMGRNMRQLLLQEICYEIKENISAELFMKRAFENY